MKDAEGGLGCRGREGTKPDASRLFLSFPPVSYAGARAAHMRKLYPDLVFGGIASSAVTRAEIFYSGEFFFVLLSHVGPQTDSTPFAPLHADYMDAIRQWAPQDCVRRFSPRLLVPSRR